MEPVKPQIMPARAKRKRPGMAALSGKTDDNMACLRGAENRGAEKKALEPLLAVTNSFYPGFILLSAVKHSIISYVASAHREGRSPARR
jgi:hypothetical protein